MAKEPANNKKSFIANYYLCWQNIVATPTTRKNADN